MQGRRRQANILFTCLYQSMFLQCKFCYESEAHRMQFSHSLLGVVFEEDKLQKKFFYRYQTNKIKTSCRGKKLGDSCVSFEYDIVFI